jgi:hypothetical protein
MTLNKEIMGVCPSNALLGALNVRLILQPTPYIGLGWQFRPFKGNRLALDRLSSGKSIV